MVFKVRNRCTTALQDNDGVRKQMDLSDLDVNHSHSTLDMSDSDSSTNEGNNSCHALSFTSDSCGAIELERKDSISTRSRSERKSVRFSNVQIREYPLCIGDNPSCELGVPIALDWRPLAEHITSIEEYQEEDRPHKTEDELRLSAQFRDALLRRAGFSSEQMRRAVQRVNVKKMERRATVDGIPQQPVEEAVERAMRGLWNATVGRAGKQREREMLQRWLQQDAILWQGTSCSKSLVISAPF